MARRKNEKSPNEFNVADLRKLDNFKSVKRESIDVLRPMFDVMFRLFIITLRQYGRDFGVAKVRDYYHDKHLVVYRDGSLIEIQRVFRDVQDSSTQNGNYDIVDRLFFRVPVGLLDREANDDKKHLEELKAKFWEFHRMWPVDAMRFQAAVQLLENAKKFRLPHGIREFYGLDK